MSFFFNGQRIVGDDFDTVTFFSNDIGLNSINVNNVVRYDDNYDDDCDPETINHIRLMAWYMRCQQHKACKN